MFWTFSLESKIEFYFRFDTHLIRSGQKKIDSISKFDSISIRSDSPGAKYEQNKVR